VRRALAVLVAGAALAAPAAALAAKPPVRYSGTSAITTKVGFRLAAGQVRGFAIGYVAACDDGETLRGTYRFKPTKVTDGRFSVRGPSTGILPDGRTTASMLRLNGRVSGAKARGSFSIVTQTAVRESQGVATCRSGRVTWTAARPVS
jgi:hypothetical protein